MKEPYNPYKHRLPDIHLETDRLVVRPPQIEDIDEWMQVRNDNYQYLKPFEPRWPRKYLTEEYQINRYARQLMEWAEDHRYAFIMQLKSNDTTTEGQIIGGININNVTRFASQCAAFGYWTAETHQGKGYMTEAIAILIDFGFDILKLKRLEISCLLHNEKSQRIAEKLKFEKIGIAKKYLQIDGKRQDHVLFELTKDKYSTYRTTEALGENIIKTS